MHTLRLFPIALFGLLLSPSILAQAPEASHQAEQVVSPTRQNIASTNADATWRPSTEQRISIETTTRAYFSARDSNKSDEAYAFFSERLKKYQSPSDFQKRTKEFNTKAGPVQARHLRAITWYKDTPQTGPGLYIAVDYSSEFPNLALHCGYVVWHEELDGTFLQVREEENVIDNATLTRLKPGDLEKIRAQFRC